MDRRFTKMEMVGCLCLLVISILASSGRAEEAESRQFSSQPYYIADSGEVGDHVRFPDDDISPGDLETAASTDGIQGLQFYAVQNGNMPLLIYPVSNAGLTSSADGGDLHTLDTMNQPQSTQPDTSNQNDFEESLKNVAHGFIFPSSPATSHEDIFKQLLAAGSQGPASEPYVIPTPQANKQAEPEPIIAIPQVANAFIIQPTAQPIIATYNLKQYANEPIYLAQQMTSNEAQQHKDSTQYQSQDANAIPVEAQYLQDKPSHFYMVGPHTFGEEPSSEPQKEEEVRPTSPFREEPSKIPLHPPPPMKASTYGPPKPVHSSAAPGPPNRYYPSNHRPSGPPRPPAYQIKGSGSHSKGPPKSRPPPNSYRLHSGPHHHHSYPHHHHHRDSLRHHHRDTPHHHHQHKEAHYQNEDPHHHHSPPPKPQYDVHESKHNDGPGRGPPHRGRPPIHSSHKHPYNFHHHGPPKTSNYGGPQPLNSGSSGNSRPPINYYEPPNKPPYRHGPQKGPHQHGPPKSVSYNSPSGSNSAGNHPAITKAIFHSSNSPDQSLDQNGGPPIESHNYPPERPEYDSEPSPATHATLSYSSATHDNHRPSDASPAASIVEPYVKGPPRPAYPDEEDDDSNPTVEVYGPMSETYYGADPYQRIKQTFKPPVIVYKGVRPPVRVYQKPETGPPFHHLPNPHSIHGKPTQNHPISHSYSPSIESTWANHNTAPTPYYHQQRVRGSYSVASPSASSKSSEPPSTNVAQEIHLTTKPPFRYSPSSSSTSGSSPPDSIISSSDDSSSWTPINAPAGAVPARAYHIPAPDLSRGSSQPTNHHISYYSSANSRADEEDVVLTEQNSSNPSGSSSSLNSLVTGTGSSHLRRENNSEEVVSAVVLVKHR